MSTIRAIAHVHSDWSYDGRRTLDQVARAFGRRGYDAVLLSEHDRGYDADRWARYREACATASPPAGPLLVPGMEYSDAENLVHVPSWGAPFLGEGLATGDLLAALREAGGVGVLAHPRRKEAWRRFDPAWVPLLLGIELWNRKTDGFAPSLEARRLLAAHPGLVAFVGPDFHEPRQFFPLAMAIEIDGEGEPSEAAILDALRARRCSPRVFRLPAEPFARGPAFVAARGAERARRATLRTLRRARARARRQGPSGA